MAAEAGAHELWVHSSVEIASFRMDAALEAMAPLGFSGKRVRKTEYGGNEGWIFIEAYAYRELIEAMLRDDEASNDPLESVEDQNFSKPDEEGGDVSGTAVAETGEKDMPEPESNPPCQEVEVEIEGRGSSDEGAKTRALPSVTGPTTEGRPKRTTQRPYWADDYV